MIGVGCLIVISGGCGGCIIEVLRVQRLLNFRLFVFLHGLPVGIEGPVCSLGRINRNGRQCAYLLLGGLGGLGGYSARLNRMMRESTQWYKLLACIRLHRQLQGCQKMTARTCKCHLPCRSLRPLELWE